MHISPARLQTQHQVVEKKTGFWEENDQNKPEQGRDYSKSLDSWRVGMSIFLRRQGKPLFLALRSCFPRFAHVLISRFFFSSTCVQV